VGVESHDHFWKTVPALSSFPITAALERLRDLPAGNRALLVAPVTKTRMIFPFRLGSRSRIGLTNTAPFGRSFGYTTAADGFAGWAAHWAAGKDWHDAPP